MKVCFQILGIVLISMVSGYGQSSELSPVYNGREYAFNPAKMYGTPYFNEMVLFEKGEVTYDQVLYKEVPLMYNLVTDELVTQRSHMFVNIVIVKDFVEQFSLRGSLFVHLKDNVTKTGYYEQIFKSDKYHAYIKHSKNVINSSSPGQLNEYNKSRTYFYQLREEDAKLVQFKKVKSLIPTDKEQRKVIKRLLKENALQNSNDLTAQTVLVLSYLSDSPK